MNVMWRVDVVGQWYEEERMHKKDVGKQYEVISKEVMNSDGMQPYNEGGGVVYALTSFVVFVCFTQSLPSYLCINLYLLIYVFVR